MQTDAQSQLSQQANTTTCRDGEAVQSEDAEDHLAVLGMVRAAAHQCVYEATVFEAILLRGAVQPAAVALPSPLVPLVLGDVEQLVQSWQLRKSPYISFNSYCL